MTPQTQELLSELENFCFERVNFRLYDERRCVAPQLLLKLSQLKIFGMQIPKSYGGLELNHTESFKLIAGIGKIDMTLGAWIGQNNSLGIRPLVNHGTLKQKEKYLPALARGEKLISFAATDPQSGSNVSGMTTLLKVTPEGLSLSGEKWFVGNALWADLFCVLSKYQGQDGLATHFTLSLIDSSNPGLKVQEELLTMGLRSSVQNIIRFEEARVSPEDIIGEITEGGKIAAETMALTRAGIGALALGGLQKCLDLAISFSKDRKIATGLLAENHWTKKILQDIQTKHAILDSIVSWIGTELDEGHQIPEEFFMAAKVGGSEYLWESVDQTMQLQGGRGYLESNQTPQLLRDARALRILEGPTEALRYHLGLLSRRKTKIENFFNLHHAQASSQLLSSSLKALETEDSKSLKEMDEAFLIFKGQLFEISLFHFCLSTSNKYSDIIRDGCTYWLKKEAERVILNANQYTTSILAHKDFEALLPHATLTDNFDKVEVYLKSN